MHPILAGFVGYIIGMGVGMFIVKYMPTGWED
jgi:hypothetical protein